MIKYDQSYCLNEMFVERFSQANFMVCHMNLNCWCTELLTTFVAVTCESMTSFGQPTTVCTNSQFITEKGQFITLSLNRRYLEDSLLYRDWASIYAEILIVVNAKTTQNIQKRSFIIHKLNSSIVVSLSRAEYRVVNALLISKFQIWNNSTNKHFDE